MNLAYKVACSFSSTPHGSSGGPSNIQNNSMFWKTLWRLNVPNKIRSFPWRACKNLLLTKSNLQCRKILDDPTCDACGKVGETSGHALWACEIAQAVWSQLGLTIHSRGPIFNSFLDFLWHLVFPPTCWR